jgi:biopolymer transport protein TolR
MAGSSDKSGGMIVGINVTPLVDVVLVLLLIFIVTAKIVAVPALSMELPAAASGSDVQVVFSVMIDPSGNLTVDGAAVRDDAAFVDLAIHAQATHDDLRAVIHADGAVPHRAVIHVMDMLKRAKISRIAFATAPIPEAP